MIENPLFYWLERDENEFIYNELGMNSVLHRIIRLNRNFAFAQFDCLFNAIL